MHTSHIECIDGKCNYSTQKHLEQMFTCPRNNTSTIDLYGAKSSGFERFRHLSIPAMLLHIDPPIQEYDEPLYEIDEHDNGNMLDEATFTLLLQSVQDNKVPKRLRTTKKKEKKQKEKTHKSK